MTAKEDFENDSRYHRYCELLLEIAKNEQKNAPEKRWQNL